VLINDLLASGEIPYLFNDDEMENILTGLRSEVKGLGLMDTRENCHKFFIDRVRKQLKVCNNKPDGTDTCLQQATDIQTVGHKIQQNKQIFMTYSKSRTHVSK